MGKADFFVELDVNGDVKVWRKGQLLETVPVGATNGTISAAFRLNGFTTSSTVSVNVFFNGRLLDINSADGSSTAQTFSWENNNTNYIGLSARATIYAEIDYLAIRKLPLAASLASEFALMNGLTGSESALDADPDLDGHNNFVEWLKGGDPNQKDASRQLISILPNTSGQSRFTYYRPTESTEAGLGYSFRCSTNLVEWTVFTPEQVSAESEFPGYERIECLVPESVSGDVPALFVLIETVARPPF